MTKNNTATVEEIESVEVTLGDVVYTTNELTGFQDQALAKLLGGLDLDGLLSNVTVDDSDNNVSDAAIGVFQQRLIKELLHSIGDGKLVTFLSIVLVPKDNPVYRQDKADALKEVVGDLNNAQIKAVFANFFARNVPSIVSTFQSFSASLPVMTEEVG